MARTNRPPSPVDLGLLDSRQLLALFTTLDAPAIDEMHGEYAARLLQQPTLLAAVLGHGTVGNPVLPGRWLCKAFRPDGTGGGRGYNSFRQLGRVVQRYPMRTLLAPSRFDGRPAYQLVYRAYHSLCGEIHMVDEVRRVEAGLYLGIGTWGFSERQRRQPLPFELSGPVGPYQGDIGAARAGDGWRHEIPALKKDRKT